MDIATVTLEDALESMSLPCEVGTDSPREVITAQNGQAWPVPEEGHGSLMLAFRGSAATITLDEALAIYVPSLKTCGSRGTACPPLREFGEDPIRARRSPS